MQPGDTIEPTITITNLGTAHSGEPIQVALVASTTPELHRGQLDRRAVQPQDEHPPRLRRAAGRDDRRVQPDLNPLNNTFTFTGPAVTLPTSPATYFLGVVVDPYGKIKQLSLPKNPLAEIHAWARPSAACRRPGSSRRPTPIRSRCRPPASSSASIRR